MCNYFEYYSSRWKGVVFIFRKECSQCGKPSFSGRIDGNWFCPHCGEDLSPEKSIPAGQYDLEKSKIEDGGKNAKKCFK